MKRLVSQEAAERLAKDLKSLPRLDLETLKERWRELYGTEPPPRLGRNLLTRAVAYRMQEKVHGGLSPATRRLLLRIAEAAKAGRTLPQKVPSKLKTGTRLLREWHGVTHEVTMLEDGVLFRGKQHGSLSEVAGIITGNRRSGPLFFGLKTAEKVDD